MASAQPFQVVAPNASPDEAAAIVAAVEQFLRQTAPAPVKSEQGLPAWQQAALIEGVHRDPQLKTVTPFGVRG